MTEGADWRFELEGEWYVFTPFHDEISEEPYRAAIVRLHSACPGHFDFWEISAPAPSVEEAFRRLHEGFHLEFPNRHTRAQAERLVSAMLAQGLLQRAAATVEGR